MKLSPRLYFSGQCREAFEFYERCLGGKIQMMLTYGDSPAAQQVPPHWREKIIHATLVIGESILYGEDAVPEKYQAAQGFQLTIGLHDPAEVERVFKALSENGKVMMPPQKTFWSLSFGVLVDQFGISWEVNCQQPS